MFHLRPSQPRTPRSGAGVMERGVQLEGWPRAHCFLTYESSVLYSLRFMIDTGIVGGCWVSLPAGAYDLVPPSRKRTHCQREVHVHYSRLISHPAEGAPAQAGNQNMWIGAGLR